MHVSGDSFFLNKGESGLIGPGHYGFVECGGEWIAYSIMDVELIGAASHANAGNIVQEPEVRTAAGYRAGIGSGIFAEFQEMSPC